VSRSSPPISPRTIVLSMHRRRQMVFHRRRGSAWVRCIRQHVQQRPRGVRTAALSGQGVTLLPEILAAADLAACRLVRLLRGYSVQQAPVYSVFPFRRGMSEKVRSFVDFAIERFGALRRMT
jgi:DNA-binding transcriptional LysR family regulator